MRFWRSSTDGSVDKTQSEWYRPSPPYAKDDPYDRQAPPEPASTLRADSGQGRAKMDSFLIRGGTRLKGTIEISGSKNSSLPIVAACLMPEGRTRLHGVPRLSDIAATARGAPPLQPVRVRHRHNQPS